MRFGRLATTAAIVLTVSCSTGSAAAPDDICTSLEADLVSLEQGPAAGAASSYRQYDDAVTRQRGELDRINSQAQRAGCTGLFIFQPKPSARCTAMMATVARVKAHLQRLTELRDRYSTDPFRLGQRRSQLLNALAANRCGPGDAIAGTPPPGGGNFLDMLFGNARRRGWNDRYYSPGGQFGTYRTLCVRSCDGYYFPISFSTVPARFASDEETCRSMCPGADVGLYVYRNPGEDVSQMVSLTGEPYSALPTAFRYRQEYDVACTCRGAVAATLAPTTPPADVVTSSPAPTSLLPTPLPRPVRGEDPETLADHDGNFMPRPVAAVDADAAAAGADSAARTVRIVGPSFYSAP